MTIHPVNGNSKTSAQISATNRFAVARPVKMDMGAISEFIPFPGIR